MALRRAGRFAGIALLLVAFGALGALAYAWFGPWPALAQLAGGGAGAKPFAAQDAPEAGPGVAVLSVARPGTEPLLFRTDAAPAATDEVWRRTVESRAAEVRLGQRQLFFQCLQDDDHPIRQTAWYKAQPDPEAAAAAVRKALTVRPVAGTALIVVQASGLPAADASVLVNGLCERYIQNRREAARQVEEQQIMQLKKERVLIDNELHEEVMRLVSEKEAQLGLDQVGTALSWNGKQLQLERLLREQSDVRTRLAGAQAEYNELVAARGEGTVPADIMAAADATPTVQMLRAELVRARLCEADAGAGPPAGGSGPTTAPADAAPADVAPAGVAPAKAAPADAAPAIVVATNDATVRRKQREALVVELLSEAYEEARQSVYSARLEAVKRRIVTDQANNGRIEDLIVTLSKQLGELNKVMAEYRRLQDRQQELQKKQALLNEEISKINQFRLNAPWTEVDFAARASAAAK